MWVNPQSYISKKGGKWKIKGGRGVMKTRIGRTCSMILGEATDMDKQHKQVSKKNQKTFLDILSKQYVHANLKRVRNCTFGLFFFFFFLHRTREQFLSWFSWPRGFSQRSQQVFFLLLVLAWRYGYLHCLPSHWPVGSTRAFFNQCVFEGRQDCYWKRQYSLNIKPAPRSLFSNLC